MTILFKNYYEDELIEDIITRDANNLKVKIKNVSINISLNEALKNKKDLLIVLTALELITSQYPKVTYSKKAIANFNLKKDIPIGSSITLSDENRKLFIEKLKIFTLPAIKELTASIKNNFDKDGNYSMGIKDLTVLPEISPQYDKFQILKGMDLSVISVKKKETNTKLLLTNNQLPLIK